MTSSTNPKFDSTPARDGQIPEPDDGIQTALAGLSSIDEIIKATAAWLLTPRTAAPEHPTQTVASTVVRTDPQWASAAEAYVDATRALGAANVSLSLAKMALYELTRNPQERGCGVVVTIPGRWSEIDPAEAMTLLESAG